MRLHKDCEDECLNVQGGREHCKCIHDCDALSMEEYTSAFLKEQKAIIDAFHADPKNQEWP